MTSRAPIRTVSRLATLAPRGRLRTALESARRAFSRFRGYQPVTSLGLFAAAGAIHLVRAYAIEQDDLVAAVLGWVGIGLLGLAFVFVVLGLAVLAYVLRERRPGAELRMETEGEVPIDRDAVDVMLKLLAHQQFSTFSDGPPDVVLADELHGFHGFHAFQGFHGFGSAQAA